VGIEDARRGSLDLTEEGEVTPDVQQEISICDRQGDIENTRHPLNQNTGEEEEYDRRNRGVRRGS
jgi:hypothetical protein